MGFYSPAGQPSKKAPKPLLQPDAAAAGVRLSPHHRRACPKQLLRCAAFSRMLLAYIGHIQSRFVQQGATVANLRSMS